MTTGQQIRKLRAAKGWTQAQLGDFVGIDGRNITRYETDRVRPRKGMLQRLADALTVPVEELEAGASQPETVGITDPELLEQLQLIEQLNDEDKFVLKRVINAVLVKSRVHNLTR